MKARILVVISCLGFALSACKTDKTEKPREPAPYAPAQPGPGWADGVRSHEDSAAGKDLPAGVGVGPVGLSDWSDDDSDYEFREGMDTAKAGIPGQPQPGDVYSESPQNWKKYCHEPRVSSSRRCVMYCPGEKRFEGVIDCTEEQTERCPNLRLVPQGIAAFKDPVNPTQEEMGAHWRASPQPELPAESDMPWRELKAKEEAHEEPSIPGTVEDREPATPGLAPAMGGEQGR